MKKIIALALSLLVAAPAWAAPKIGEPAPEFSAQDISGAAQSLAQYKGKVVVLEWNNPGCPFVKKFYDGGRMQKFQADAVAKGVVWLVVNSSAAGKQGSMTADEAKAQLATWKSTPTAYILDPEGKIGKLYEAKTTPHMYVVDKDGKLAYMGAIDDKPSTDAKDIDGAKNYVFAALDAIAAGKPVENASTTAYGCNVKYKD
jgi:hypothetical protein